ncbi:hypothetical protein Vretimale_16258 [Volvox reticuliferus]|uniref:Uncharacterized protein n=1 Tax=Volvox reticuliferus TaxID=1737510 RepID=A0A8J4GTP0_9CHLO|nr:hypothetical protein Vretimale_16258 [Volvox reticuliferus]
MHDGIHVLRSTTTSKHPKWRHQHQQGVYLLACCCLAAFLRSTLTQPSSTGITYGPWNASEDLNEQHKAVLRFILSGDTSFWSRPAVAYRIGFGTAPWRCISRCQAQYYASAAECAPDCTTQTYCEPGDAALSDSNTTCCALSLLDQSYSFSHPSTAVSPSWCNTYPPWGMKLRPSVCDVNVYSARGLQAPLGARDPFLAVSCSRANVTSFYVNGTQYRKDTARRIIHDKDIRKANVTRNIVKRISLRHMAAWHHPSININEPPQFSLVDDLVCLPLEEIYFEDVYFRPDYEGFAVFPDRSGANNSTFDLFDPTTWTCDLAGKRIGNNFYHNLDGFGFELGGEIQTQIINFSYFEMLWDPCGVGRALVQRNETSLNPNLALRNVALDKCLFSPFTELNAMRWSGRARQEWSEAVRNAMVSIKYGNQSLPRIVDALAPDAVATRPFLPDTLKRLTIKRTNDGSHPSKTWRGKPVIKGFLPSEWALLQKLEYLDLSDDMGQGLIEGPIPSTWLMMTKLRTINLTGHSNFCKDWHRIVSYQHFVRCGYVYQVHFAQKGPQIEAKMKPLFDQLCSQPSFYYAGTAALFSKQFASNKLNMSVRIFDLDGHGWQWYDPSTGEAGYTNVIAPDGKCCWDIYSDQIAAHNYRLKGPTTWRDDYQNDYLMSRFFILNDFCERAPPFTIPPKATGPRPPIPPVAPIPPEIPPVPPLTPTTLGAISFPPRPPLFSPLPGISPLRPSAPPQPRLSPSFPGKWTGAWAWRPILPPRPPPSPPPPSPSPSPPLFPPPPPIDCNLAKAQVSFAITNVSRGPFYIGIAVPDMSSLYCKACGCTLQYTALARGFSALYYSSSGLSPPPSNLANISTSVNNWVSNVTISPATSAGRQLMQTTGTLGPLPSLEDLIALGPGRGVLTELNITAPYSSWSSRGSLGAGWRMDPASDGDYLFRIQVGGSIWYRWVVVDSSPPHVSGQLLMSKTPMMVVSPVIAAKDENASPLRYLILNLNMSEPVMEFNLTTALQLSGGVSLFRYECFKSADTAAEVMKGAGVAALATAGSPVLADGPPPPVVPAVPPPSQQQQQPIGGGVVDFAAASGIPFARSCLAELYAAEGSKPSIFLSGCSVKDLSGNRGSGTLSIQIRIPKPELGSTDTVARASAILTSVSFLSVLASRWSVLQSAYHIQMLAMSANMASPGVSSGYRRVARYLRWSLMSIKGNIPLLDKAFKNPKEVNVSDIVNTNLGAELKSANGTNGGPPMPPASPKPPYLPNPLEGPPRRSRARTLISSNEKAPPLAMGTAGLSSSPPSPPAELTAGRDVLIAWLMSMSEFSSGNSSSSKDNTECNSDGNITGSNFYFTNSYVIGGAAAAGNSRAVVGVDSSGRVLNTSDNGGRPPPAPSQAGASTGNIMILADMQDLLYTIATAAILMGGLVLGHALVNLLYCRFISRELPALLHFPRAEMTFGGLLLVSITFYSSFALGGPAAQWGSSRTPAALVMSCIVMPYLVLVWWLTVCRWYLVEKPSEIMEKTSVLLPGAISMQPGAGVDSQQPSSEQNCKDRRSSGNVGGQGTQEGRPTGTDRLLLRHGDSSSKRTACCQTDPLPLRQQVPANPGNVIMGPHWDVAPEDDSMHSANGEWKLGLYRTVSPTRARAALLVGRSIRLLSARPRESTSAIADIRRSRPDVCGLTPEGIILCEEHRNAFHEVESHQQVIPRKDDSFSEAGMAQDSTYQGRHQQNSGAADLSLLVGSFRDMVQSSGALETHREVSGATSTMGADNGQHVKFSPPLGSTKPDSDQQGLRSALPKAAGVASRHPGQGMTEGTSSPGAAAADDNTRIPSVSQGACANLSQRAMRVSGEDNITRLDPQPELLLTVDTTNESFAQHGFRCKDKVTGLPQPTMDESECQIEDVNTLHVKAKKHGSATPTKDRVLITMVDHSNPFSKATDGQAAGQGVVGMPPLKHAVGRAGKKMLPKDARTLDNSISGRWKEDSLRDGPGKHAMEAEGSFLPAVDSAGGVLLQEAPSTMAAADMNNNMKDWAPIPYAAPEVMPRDSVLGENDLAKSFFSSRVLTTRRSSLQQLQGMAGADSRDSGVIYPRRRSTGSYLNNDLAHPKLHTLKPGSRDSLSPSRGSQEHDRPAAPASTNKMGGTEPQVHNFAASNYSSLSRFAQTTSQKQTNTPIKNTNVEIATEDSTQPQELPDRPQQQLIRHAGWLHERNSTKNTPALKMPFGPADITEVQNVFP